MGERARIGGAALLLLLMWAGHAGAQGQGGASSCTISTTSVAFGVYDVFNSSPVNSTGTVTYRCGAQVSGGISVSLSQGQSGSYLPRTLIGGSDTLAYNLYLDAASTTVWGDGTGGTQAHVNGNPPKNTNITITIYGQIPAAQDVSAGSYADTIVASINF